MEQDSTLQQLMAERYAEVVKLPANIQLRKVKHLDQLSEETLAFTAEVWIDGVKYGEVENTGKGGGHRYHPHQLEAVLARAARAAGFVDGLENNVVAMTSALAEGREVPDEGTRDHNALVLDAEFFFDRLLMRHDLEAELRRKLPTTILFIDQRGALRRTAGKLDRVWLAGVVDNPKLQGAVLEQLDARAVINFAPPEARLALYANGLGRATQLDARA